MSELGKSSSVARLQLGLKFAGPKVVSSHPQAYHSINCSFAACRSRNEVGQHRGTLTQEKEKGAKRRIKLVSCIPSASKSRESSVLADKDAQTKELASESFGCQEPRDGELRPRSQFAKVCALQLKCGARNACSQAKKHKLAAGRVGHYTCGDDKENVDKSNKIAIKISTDKNAVSKKLLGSTNGTFINNLSTSSAVCNSQLGSAKKANFAKLNEPPQPSTERSNSKFMELALRLERKVKKYKGSNKLSMYSSCFDEIIKADPYFGTLLREIKNEYEFTITELASKENSGANAEELQAECKRHEDKNAALVKELKRQALYIEKLKGSMKELKKAKDLGAKGKTKVSIPKLDLSKICSAKGLSSKEQRTKDVTAHVHNDVLLMDYQDEFMAMEEAFSQSWKDALANEKRH